MRRKSSLSLEEENENEDMEVTGLEKWLNDYKAKISHEEGNLLKYVHGKLKKIEDRDLKQVSVDDPFINQTIVNMALYDDELEKYFFNEMKNSESKADYMNKELSRSNFFSLSSVIDDRDREKSRKSLEPIKSFESLKNELKKQIFNKVLLDKMTRETAKSDILNGKVSDKIEDIIKITKEMKFTDLLNNFKCLQNDKNSNIIEYEFLFKKLAQSKIKPSKIFDFANYETRMKKINNDLILMEHILMEKYNELNEEINKKKTKMNAIRENIATLTGTARRLQDEKEIIIKKLEAIEEKLITNGSQASPNSIIFNSSNNFAKMSKNIKKAHFNNISNADFLKLDRFRSERKQQESQLATVIEKVQNDLKKDRLKMNHLDLEMKELNFKKLSVRLHLREIYQKIFKSHDKFLQEQGIIWIINSCWKIGENPPINLFPKIIDEISIEFLISYAKLDNELTEQRRLLKEKKNEMAKYLIVDNHISSEMILQNTNYLKQKYNDFKKSLTSTHKKALRREDERNFFFGKGSMRGYFQNQEEIEEVKSIRKNNLEIEPSNKQITELKNTIENAKLQEFKRNVKKFKDLGLEKKVFEDFFLLMKYLFGQKEGSKYYESYLQLLNRKVDPLALTLQDERNENVKENWTEKTRSDFEKLKNSVMNDGTELDLRNNFHFFKKSFKSNFYTDENENKFKNFFRLRTE